MNIDQQKLVVKALSKHPGKILKYCGDKTNWENCFTTEEVGRKKYLFFWYNLESGDTYTESLLISNNISDLKKDHKN